jgi:hypothetical protein
MNTSSLPDGPEREADALKTRLLQITADMTASYAAHMNGRDGAMTLAKRADLLAEEAEIKLELRAVTGRSEAAKVHRRKLQDASELAMLKMLLEREGLMRIIDEAKALSNERTYQLGAQP